MKRLAAVLIAGLLLAGCAPSPAPSPSPSTDAEVAACMEARGYPLDKPANEIEGFTMDGMRAAAEACGLDD